MWAFPLHSKDWCKELFQCGLTILESLFKTSVIKQYHWLCHLLPAFEVFNELVTISKNPTQCKRRFAVLLGLLMTSFTFDLFSLFEQAFCFLTADLSPVTASFTFPLSHAGGLLECFVFFLNYGTYFIWAPNTIFFKSLHDVYRLLGFGLLLFGCVFICFSGSIASFFL